jgi:hypothetical protein
MLNKKVTEAQYKKNLSRLANLSKSDLEELQKVETEAIASFKGDISTLSSALGFLRLGHHVGWRVLVMAYHKATVKKYEDILSIDIRTFFPEEGPSSERSIGLTIAKKLNKFWDIVRGQEKIDGKREIS